MIRTQEELNASLFEATRFGERLEVELLLDSGADINATDIYGDTVLHLAAWHGHKERCELFLDCGIPVNIKSKHGYTALHRTAAQGHVKTAGFLLDRGANIDAKNNDGKTPLHCAAAMGKLHLADLLIERGADKYAVDNKNISVEFWGLHYVEIVRIFTKSQEVMQRERERFMARSNNIKSTTKGDHNVYDERKTCTGFDQDNYKP